MLSKQSLPNKCLVWYLNSYYNYFCYDGDSTDAGKPLGSEYPIIITPLDMRLLKFGSGKTDIHTVFVHLNAEEITSKGSKCS